MPNDKNNMCVAALNFGGSGHKITTKDCDGYCGLNAGGPMDGVCQRKIRRKNKAHFANSDDAN